MSDGPPRLASPRMHAPAAPPTLAGPASLRHVSQSRAAISSRRERVDAALAPEVDASLARSDAANGVLVTPAALSKLPPPPAASRGYVRAAEALMASLALASVAAFSITVWHLVAFGATQLLFAWAIAGLFTALSVLLSAHTIHLHLRHYVSALQKFYVRIVFIITVYSVQSWLALRFLDARIYIEAMRDMYEAFAVYSFYQLMLQFLGGPRVLAARLLATGARRSRCLPCCPCWRPGWCCRPWRNGMRFVHRCEVGIYQYVLTRVVCAVLTIITAATGTFHGISPHSFEVYNLIAVNVSQTYALTCLALFYVNTRQWLAPLKPLYKFGLIKLIIFVLFWQSAALIVAGFYGVVRPFWQFPDEAAAAAGIEDFAICIELFFFAILAHFFFSYRDFVSTKGEVPPLARLRLYQAAFLERQASQSAVGAQRSVELVAPALVLPQPQRLQSVQVQQGGQPQQQQEQKLERLRSKATLATAAFDVLPLDIIVETGRHARTGFGLLHRLQKRRLAPKMAEPNERRRAFPWCCLTSDR